MGGVSVLNDDTVRVNYTTANSHLKHNWITALAQVGDEWFAGTYGAGVLRLDTSGEWHSFPDLKDGFVVNPNAMAVSGNHLYAGSLDRGLFVFDRASGRWTNTTHGTALEERHSVGRGRRLSLRGNRQRSGAHFGRSTAMRRPSRCAVRDRLCPIGAGRIRAC